MATIGTSGPAAARRSARIAPRFSTILAVCVAQPARLEQAIDFVPLRVEAREVVRPDVDRDERDLVFVRLEKADRLRKLRPFRIENVLVVTRGTAAQNDGRILAAEAHRHRRLAPAAELDE